MLKYVFCKKNNATKKPGAFTFIKRLGAFAGIECQEVSKKSDDVI